MRNTRGRDSQPLLSDLRGIVLQVTETQFASQQNGEEIARRPDGGLEGQQKGQVQPGA